MVYHFMMRSERLFRLEILLTASVVAVPVATELATPATLGATLLLLAVRAI